MGWFTYDTQTGYQIGPNLQMIFNDGKIPSKQEADWTDGDRNPEYYRTGKDQSGVTWIFLTMHVSWKFTNLNAAFPVKAPTRSLQVYSDAHGSSMIGNKNADLLREIKYYREGKGSMYFEPQHIQYLPVRKQIMESVEVQIVETTGQVGDLVQFGPGSTFLTLHFKKDI